MQLAEKLDWRGLIQDFDKHELKFISVSVSQLSIQPVDLLAIKLCIKAPIGPFLK
jgi:hypothetical protein